MLLDYQDRADFADTDRGFIDTLDPLIIKAADGRVVFDSTGFAYLDGERPDTVHPSLWRQAQLCWKNGLYQVTEGIYQVRGFDPFEHDHRRGRCRGDCASQCRGAGGRQRSQESLLCAGLW